LSGGPNSALQDPIAARLLPGCAPQRCWVDHIEAYSLNEVTVNWNSAFAWLSNWVAEHSVPTAPPAGCKVAYSASTWPTGLTATIKLTNTGTTAWDAWNLSFAFSGNERIQHGWSATWSQTGRDVVAKNVDWNKRIAPGASVTVGFYGSKSGTHTPPAAFKVNGGACTTA
jgi:endoglucanase